MLTLACMALGSTFEEALLSLASDCWSDPMNGRASRAAVKPSLYSAVVISADVSTFGAQPAALHWSIHSSSSWERKQGG